MILDQYISALAIMKTDRAYKAPSIKIAARAIFCDVVRWSRNMTAAIRLVNQRYAKAKADVQGQGSVKMATSVAIFGTALPMKNA